MQFPSILNSVDAKSRLSSKWVAHESGKTHFHVIRDIELLLEQANPHKDVGDNIEEFCVERIYLKNNKVSEILLSLPLAVAILSRYTGPKSNMCLRIVIAAVDYFITRAPLAERRIKDLEEDLAWERKKKSRQSLPSAQGPSKVLVRVLIEDLLPGFQSYFVDRYVTPDVAANMRQEQETAKLSHLRKTEAGVSKKRQRQEDFVLGALN